YYQSLPHDVIQDGLERKIKDRQFIELVKITLFCYVSSEEIERQLEDEEERKKRRANWCLYKPATRQLRAYKDRPSHEGSPEGERLLSLQ
ncbi:MAG: hypothetical protein K2H22_09400, partial [Muribaculaceae bacterium]|nr:hypothetical protein [Muribaculaceae bacterium]